MSKSDIIKKLTSRKWWMAFIALISGIVTVFWGEQTAAVVGGLLLQLAAVISYTIGEGLVDAANKPSDSEAEPQIEYRYLDENGVPVDGHYMLVHNVEEAVCEATQCGTCDEAETCDLSKYIDETIEGGGGKNE